MENTNTLQTNYQNLQDNFIIQTQAEIIQFPEKNIFSNFPTNTGFSQIPECVADHVLSFGNSTTLNVYRACINNIPNWEINIKNIAKRARINKDTARIHMKKLIDEGYIVRDLPRNPITQRYEKGRYRFFAFSIKNSGLFSENPRTIIPDTEIPVPVNPVHNNTNFNNNKTTTTTNNNLVSSQNVPEVSNTSLSDYENYADLRNTKNSDFVVVEKHEEKTQESYEEQLEMLELENDKPKPVTNSEAKTFKPKHVKPDNSNVQTVLDAINPKYHTQIKKPLDVWKNKFPDTNRMIEITLAAIECNPANLSGLLFRALQYDYIPKRKKPDSENQDLYTRPQPPAFQDNDMSLAIKESYSGNISAYRKEQIEETKKFMQEMSLSERLKRKSKKPVNKNPEYAKYKRTRDYNPLSKSDMQVIMKKLKNQTRIE